MFDRLWVQFLGFTSSLTNQIYGLSKRFPREAGLIARAGRIYDISSFFVGGNSDVAFFLRDAYYQFASGLYNNVLCSKMNITDGICLHSCDGECGRRWRGAAMWFISYRSRFAVFLMLLFRCSFLLLLSEDSTIQRALLMSGTVY